jgi:predicted nucleotidyltransferase component of viral defense system
MNRDRPVNVAASVHRRLLNLGRQTGEDFNLLLVRYASERFLYRMSRSRYGDRFVLKGALLFLIWRASVHRPTRDVDLLGFGSGSPEELTSLFQEMCELEVEPDGLAFDAESIRIREIRELQEYGGQRVEFMAHLGKAHILMRVDIGFGDVVLPAATMAEYPTLLGFAAPRLRIYSRESVVAEKLHAMTVLDLTNSRLKDFYDLWVLARLFPFEGGMLQRAIAATFARRETALPEQLPMALTGAFAEAPGKAAQWLAFLRRNAIDVGDIQFAEILSELGAFLAPPLLAAASPAGFHAHWPAGGPWSK